MFGLLVIVYMCVSVSMCVSVCPYACVCLCLCVFVHWTSLPESGRFRGKGDVVLRVRTPHFLGSPKLYKERFKRCAFAWEDVAF